MPATQVAAAAATKISSSSGKARPDTLHLILTAPARSFDHRPGARTRGVDARRLFILAEENPLVRNQLAQHIGGSAITVTA